jgi:hypothetical protein
VGVPFDHLPGGGIDDFGSFSRLGGGTYSPLSVGKLGRSYQPPALYANLIYDVSWLQGRHCIRQQFCQVPRATVKSRIKPCRRAARGLALLQFNHSNRQFDPRSARCRHGNSAGTRRMAPALCPERLDEEERWKDW